MSRQLLIEAQAMIQPDGRTVLHAQPAHYTLDGAHGVANPRGLHAERLGVDIHVMLADGAPVRNLTEAVQNAHLYGRRRGCGAAGRRPRLPDDRGTRARRGAGRNRCRCDQCRSVLQGGCYWGLKAVPMGSADLTDAIASGFGIRRSQAEPIEVRGRFGYCQSGRSP